MKITGDVIDALGPRRCWRYVAVMIPETRDHLWHKGIALLRSVIGFKNTFSAIKHQEATNRLNGHSGE